MSEELNNVEENFEVDGEYVEAGNILRKSGQDGIHADVHDGADGRGGRASR